MKNFISTDVVKSALWFSAYTFYRLGEIGLAEWLEINFSDSIERQLAHIEQNSVRAAYNHAEYLAERRKMIAAWADYLDVLFYN